MKSLSFFVFVGVCAADTLAGAGPAHVRVVNSGVSDIASSHVHEVQAARREGSFSKSSTPLESESEGIPSLAATIERNVVQATDDDPHRRALVFRERIISTFGSFPPTGTVQPTSDSIIFFTSIIPPSPTVPVDDSATFDTTFPPLTSPQTTSRTSRSPTPTTLDDVGSPTAGTTPDVQPSLTTVDASHTAAQSAGGGGGERTQPPESTGLLPPSQGNTGISQIDPSSTALSSGHASAPTGTATPSMDGSSASMGPSGTGGAPPSDMAPNQTGTQDVSSTAGRGRLPAGAIGGIAAGVVLLILAGAVGVICVVRRRGVKRRGGVRGVVARMAAGGGDAEAEAERDAALGEADLEAAGDRGSLVVDVGTVVGLDAERKDPYEEVESSPDPIRVGVVVSSNPELQVGPGPEESSGAPQAEQSLSLVEHGQQLSSESHVHCHSTPLDNSELSDSRPTMPEAGLEYTNSTLPLVGLVRAPDITSTATNAASPHGVDPASLSGLVERVTRAILLSNPQFGRSVAMGVGAGVGGGDLRVSEEAPPRYQA